MSSSSSQRPTSMLSKACENCRVRKIRCNKTEPCSNCAESGLTCRPAARAAEHKSRILITANYEKQIECINQRLAGIERSLRDIAQEINRPSSSHPHHPVGTDSRNGSRSNRSGNAVETPAPFEGASSFTTQALDVSQALELSSGSVTHSSEVTKGLSSLKDVLHNAQRPYMSGSIYFDPQQQRFSPELSLLPASFVLEVLRLSSSYPSVMSLTFGLPNHSQLSRWCQQIYFPTAPVSLGLLTTVHGLLYYIIHQLHSEPGFQDIDEAGVESHLALCQENFHKGIETYEISANATLDNIRALILAMLKAQEDSNSVYGWNCVSIAARHALSLGLHRKASLRNDSLDKADDKRRLFWSIYWYDKNLALNLGRTPNIHDYDMDIDVFSVSPDPQIAPWDLGNLAFIDLGRITGLTYEQLYSLSALRRSAEDRKQSIYNIDREFGNWEQRWDAVDATNALCPDAWQRICGPTKVTYYSLLTTLHRAASNSSSGTEITPACYESARKCLQTHLQYFPSILAYKHTDIQALYLSWILLYSAFTPLIVIFLHAVVSSSVADVELLHRVEDSFQQVTEGTKEFHRVHAVCKIFCKIANAFMDSNRETIVSQMDRPTTLSDLLAQEGPMSAYSAEDVSQLFGHWFAGNEAVTDLWNDFDFADLNNI